MPSKMAMGQPAILKQKHTKKRNKTKTKNEVIMD